MHPIYHCYSSKKMLGHKHLHIYLGCFKKSFLFYFEKQWWYYTLNTSVFHVIPIAELTNKKIEENTCPPK